MKDLAQESANRRSTRGETQEKEDFCGDQSRGQEGLECFSVSENPFPFHAPHRPGRLKLQREKDKYYASRG